MADRRRSTKRRRREPLRRRVPAPRPDNGLKEAPSLADGLLHPGYEILVAGMLSSVPVEAAPVYAITAAVHQALGARSTYPGIVAAGQFAQALKCLGFDSELIPACTTIAHQNHGQTRFRDIGVWERPPVMRADGTTDGHVVIWCDSLNRCIDLAPCQDSVLRQASTPEESFDHPAVLPIAGGRRQLLGQQPVAPRPPFLIHWMFFPAWAPLFEPILERNSAAIELGGLAMAHVVIDLLSALAIVRDLSQLGEQYPRLGELLSNRRSLPTLEGCAGYENARSEPTG